MIFNSIEYLFFLPIFFVLYWLFFNKNLKHQNVFILVSSYIFYGWWSWKFLGLLFLSTTLDYLCGFMVASRVHRKAKFFLILSISANLFILGFFKYYNFFIDQFQKGFDYLGITINVSFFQIVLPIGISFYTFHGMSYILDIYRGKQKLVKDYIEYSIFVSFFPLLVAGPIERASHLLPQIQNSRKFDYEQAVEGCRLILWGMMKKIIIADSLARIVDPIFNNYNDLSGTTLIVGAVAFSFQIYCDFSGYSDIAIGSAKLIGFELLSNFKFPYFSRDIAEFWRRWHISLSTWFRDYLYIPLGGSKNGIQITIRNVLIVFLVSGLWHGASWNFVVWGFIHACGFLPLVVMNKNRINESNVVAQNRGLPNFKELWQMLKTFTFVTFAWIFFRANSIEIALGYITQIFISIFSNPSQLLVLPDGKGSFLYIIVCLIIDWNFRKDERRLSMFIKNPTLRKLLYSLAISYILVKLLKGNSSNFIYFQF